MAQKKALTCICGAVIDASSVVLEPNGENEYKILCPSPKCTLREIGLAVVRHSSPIKCEVKLYPMFRDWNILLNGREKGDVLLRNLARQLSSTIVNELRRR